MQARTTLYLLTAFFLFSFSYSSSFVEIFDEPKVIVIESTLNTKECNNKAFIPLQIPKDSEGLIYSVTVVGKSEAKSPAKTLLNDILVLKDKYAPSKISDYLVPGGTNRNFNFYIIPSKKHIESFNNCGYYEYYEKNVDTKSKIAYFDLKNRDEETIYFGIENSNDLKDLRVVIEVVAVTK